MRRLTSSIITVLVAASLSAQTSLIDQGRAALQRGDHDAAISILETAVAREPNNAEGHFSLGSAYGMKAQNAGMFSAARAVGKVREEFEKAVALNPKHVEAHFALVEFYAMLPGLMGGSYEKALAHAKAIKTIDPLVGHRAYSFVYSQQKKPDLAKKEYIDALHEQPTSPKAHSFYGQYLVNVEKNYSVAVSEFETALKLDPDYMPAYYHLGRTSSLGNVNVARGEEALRKYLGYTPKENEPPIANAYYHLGSIYEKTRRKAEAKQSYQAALKLNPSLKSAAEALKRVS